MIILYIINELASGGAEHLLLDQVSSGACGWESRIVCIDGAGPLAAQAERAGVAVRSVAGRFRFDPSVVGGIREAVREWRPDVVHMHLPRSGFFGRLACAGFKGLPLVYTEHNTWDIYGPATRMANWSNYHLNDQVIAVSQAVRDSVLRHVRPGRLRRPPMVVPNGIDPDRLAREALPREAAREALGLPLNGIVVGNVGNLFTRKGQKYLLRAAARIVPRYPDVRFTIIGTGDQLGPLTELRGRLGLDGKVSIVTGVREAGRLLRAFDIFTLPSLYEGLPVALLEAMALGVPAVGAKVGGIPEVIEHGASGLLVEPRDADGLAEALVSLIESQSRRGEIGQAGQRRLAAKFTLKSMVDLHRACYTELAGSLTVHRRNEGHGGRVTNRAGPEPCGSERGEP